MSKLVFNRDGGKTDEFGHLIALMRFIQGEVIEGLQVAANGSPNMSVNVPYGIAAIPTGSGATAYRYFVGLDATENVAIPTANGSNPRNDLVVLWVDKSVTPSQSFTNNSNNMLKISVVSGAPATTPADPNTAAIQAAIGAANPYIVLARVTVGAGVTQINSGNIADLRSLVGVGRILTQQIITAHIADQAVTRAKIADDAVNGAKIQLGNNDPLMALIAAGTSEKQLVRLGANDRLRLGQVPNKQQATVTTENDIMIQTGWHYANAPGNIVGTTNAVTFPEAFDRVLGCSFQAVGVKSGSVPTGPNDPALTAMAEYVSGAGLTNNGFSYYLRHPAGANLPAGPYWCVSWIAWGRKA